MCAVEAGKRGRSVLLVDHNGSVGKKVRASGGGHCNFTNINAGYDNYISHNPHFCKSALARFTPYNFISLVEKHGISYYEKEAGQMFCKQGSQDILNMLQKECREAGVQMLTNCAISDIRKDGCFVLSTSTGIIASDSLVIATGGLSFPELGATGFGHQIASQFGLRTTELRPALVPFTFSDHDSDLFRDLSGVSLDVIATCNSRHFRGAVLFTHRGLSGPAILQTSSYWREGDPITINLLPDLSAYELFETERKSRMEMRNLLSGYLPKRFSQRWSASFIQSKPLYQYTEKELKNIADKVHSWTITPAGTEGYKKAEVTLGGVDTDELSSKTMEAKKVAGLYFTGEVVDVTGQLGGYNLQWAWSSGYVAGQYA